MTIFFVEIVILQLKNGAHEVLMLKGRVHCFSMQVVMNLVFSLKPRKKIGADPSYRFQENRKKRIFNFEKRLHRAED